MTTKQVNITDTIKADPKKHLTQDQKYPPKSHDPWIQLIILYFTTLYGHNLDRHTVPCQDYTHPRD